MASFKSACARATAPVRRCTSAKRDQGAAEDPGMFSAAPQDVARLLEHLGGLSQLPFGQQGVSLVFPEGSRRIGGFRPAPASSGPRLCGARRRVPGWESRPQNRKTKA